VTEETTDAVVDSPEEGEAEESVTDLLAQLGRDIAALVFYESRLTAARHEPELRRAARDVAASAGVVVSFLTVFLLANTAALLGLATVVSAWLAALVLAAAWAFLGIVLALALWVRAKRLSRGGPETVEEARDQAEEAVRATLEQLSKAITKEIALAAVPMAGDFVDVGGDLIESADEIVDAITDELPGGGVVNQVWDIALAPGRFGIRVATTVLKRGDSGG
jgi:Putative Actinobacterial Holin-X, holin superfamily III